MSCYVFPLVFVSVFILLIWWYIMAKFSYWTKRGIPYLCPSFPYGNIKEVGRTLHIAELMKSVYDKFKSSGQPFAGIYYFIRPVAVVTDPNLARDILIKHFIHFNDRGVYSNEIDDPISAHLFSLEGDRWKEVRKVVAPLFSQQRIKSYHEDILKVSSRLRSRIDAKLSHSANIDITDLSARYIIDAIGRCVFGINPNCIWDDEALLGKVSRRIFTMSPLETLRHLFMQTFRESARSLHMKLIKKDVADFFRGLSDKSGENWTKEVYSFVQLLEELRKGGKLSSNQVTAQAFIFFVAGFETSAITLAYCLHELAWNPSIQDRLRAEVFAQVGMGGKLSWDAINKMTFLNAVVNETLRKYPPGGNFLRVAREDFRINEKVIEKDTLVIIPLYGIHRDASIYPNPDTFDPERPQLGRNCCSFMPFGDGPRHCIGRRLALHQIKLAISSLIVNYHFRPPPLSFYNITLSKSTVLLAPQHPIHLTMEHIRDEASPYQQLRQQNSHTLMDAIRGEMIPLAATIAK
ncbi:hypothetical protein DMENIID0001_160730 [Sergentomyia squamirostris]